MKQLLIFGLGMGGEAVAGYLENELSTVEILKLIDWRSSFYDSLLPRERNQELLKQLQPYIGKVDIIVLGSYLLSLSLPYLRRHFPEQAFVGMGVNVYRVAQNLSRSLNAIALMNPALHDTFWFDELCLDLDFLKLTIPNCAGWAELIDDHAISPDILRADLYEANIALRQRTSYKRRGRPRRTAPPLVEQLSIEHTSHDNNQTAAQSVLQMRDNIEKHLHPDSFTPNSAIRVELLAYKKPPTAPRSKSSLSAPAQQQSHRRPVGSLPRQPTTRCTSPLIAPSTPGLVLLLSTHLWSIRPELEQVFGWRVKILDFRKQLLHDVCTELGLLGVHGSRAR